MTGFTIYETLRIFLPGALATLLLDISIRLGTAKDGLTPPIGSIAAETLSTLESGTGFIAASVVFGLILYLMDLPERMRLIQGDGWAPRPSSLMRNILAPIQEDPRREDLDTLGLYFIVSDAHIPEDLHKRIYLFGAIYKVSVDLRILTFGGLLLGLPIFSALARAGDPDHLVFSTASALFAGALIVSILAGGYVAEKERRLRILNRHKEDYFEALAERTPAVGQPAIWVLFTGSLAASLLPAWGWPLSWLGLPFGAGALMLWYWLEVGPPRKMDEQFGAEGFGDGSETPSRVDESADPKEPGATNGEARPEEAPTHGKNSLKSIGSSTARRRGSTSRRREAKKPVAWRESTLRRLKCEPHRHPQYSPRTKAQIDGAVLAPVFLGATALGASLGRPPVAVLAWGLLVVPAMVVAFARKHESRLLGAYRTQGTWLSLHDERIRQFVDGKLGLDDLGRSPPSGS